MLQEANCSTTVDPPPPSCQSQCKLLGGTFSVLVQLGLAFLCLLVLSIKRCREYPRRPWLIWFFDLSKQVFSSGLQHGANLLFGHLLAVHSTFQASECAWYFVLYVITSTAAIFVVWIFMAMINYLVVKRDIRLLRTGEYGTPPSWRPWLAQLLVWGAVGMSEKLLTTFALVVPFRSHLGQLATWLERPLLHDPKTELILVMIFAPVLLNIVSVIVFDHIMKRKKRRGSATAGGGPIVQGALDLGSRSTFRDPLVAFRFNDGRDPNSAIN